MNHNNLLIDGNNLLYRSIYSHLSKQTSHPVTIALMLMCSWVRDVNPTAINVFWDTPKENGWRHKIFSEYKEGRSRDDDVVNLLQESIKAFKLICGYSNIIQFSSPGMEADDLIYAACKVLAPQKCIIVSNDRDYDQIPFFMNHTVIYDPMKNGGSYREVTDYNPIIAKALSGDKSDNIDGYAGIGPKKSQKMAHSIDLLNDFLDKNGASKFVRNLMLVDMSLHPKLIHNCLYVQKKLSKKANFDKSKIYDIIESEHITGMRMNHVRFCAAIESVIKRNDKT